MRTPPFSALFTLFLFVFFSAMVTDPAWADKPSSSKITSEFGIFLNHRTGSITTKETYDYREYSGSTSAIKTYRQSGIGVQMQMDLLFPKAPLFMQMALGFNSYYGPSGREGSSIRNRNFQTGLLANAGLNFARLSTNSQMPIEPYVLAGLGWHTTEGWISVPAGGSVGEERHWENYSAHLLQFVYDVGFGFKFRPPSNPRIALGAQLQYLKAFGDL